MHTTLARLAVSVALIPALCGCALLGIGRNEPRVTALSTLPMGAEAFVRFEEGRSMLDAGQNAAAIGAFSEARMEPSLLAASLNGMGVAYARLGRIDLAERYFEQAVATAPEDRRFAANLAQAQGSLMAARRVLQAPQVAAAAPVAESWTVRAGSGVVHLQTQVNRQSRITVAPPQQRLARIDAARIELSTALAETPRAGPQVRVRVAQAPRQGQSYPIRIALAN
jgi:tetratricopeptide (TPR) repeat protein